MSSQPLQQSVACRRSARQATTTRKDQRSLSAGSSCVSQSPSPSQDKSKGGARAKRATIQSSLTALSLEQPLITSSSPLQTLTQVASSSQPSTVLHRNPTSSQMTSQSASGPLAPCSVCGNSYATIAKKRCMRKHSHTIGHDDKCPGGAKHPTVSFFHDVIGRKTQLGNSV